MNRTTTKGSQSRSLGNIGLTGFTKKRRPGNASRAPKNSRPIDVVRYGIPERMEVQHRLLWTTGKHKSLAKCLKYAYKAGPGQEDRVRLKVRSNGSVRVSGIQTCGSIGCNHCGPKIRADISRKISLAASQNTRRGGVNVFATFTHSPDDTTDNNIRATYEGINYIRKAIKNFNSKILEENKVGFIGVMEPTFSRKKRWNETKGRMALYVHSHSHVFIMLPPNFSCYDRLKKICDDAWKRGIKKAGSWCYTGSELSQKAIRWDYDAGDKSVASYIAKHINREEKNYSAEMALSHYKTNDSADGKAGRSLTELYDDIVRSGSEEDEELLLEYYTSMYRKRRFRSNYLYEGLYEGGVEYEEELDRIEALRILELPIMERIEAQIEALAGDEEDVVGEWDCDPEFWGLIGSTGKTIKVMQAVRDHMLFGLYSIEMKELNRLRDICDEHIKNKWTWPKGAPDIEQLLLSWG